MSIIVSGIAAVPDILKSKKIDAVLSIEHPNAQEGAGRVLRLENVSQKILCFWDIEKENFPDGPSDEIMREAFEFLEVHKSQDVLIHCKAGKSRSVA
ncbi:MAG: dual specificity protein phosphatase family protein, partial [Alphaproteobacteria bacterium]|nr:dual specificity protein phosphatase family protein [Alphaproteobacteria bacterium]